jgi:hypothetical protein
VAALAAGICSIGAGPQARPPGYVQLITVDEARQPDAPPGKARGLEVKPPDNGPEIVIASPENGKHYRPPVAIDIAFRPRAAAVNPASLESPT